VVLRTYTTTSKNIKHQCKRKKNENEVGIPRMNRQRADDLLSDMTWKNEGYSGKVSN